MNGFELVGAFVVHWLMIGFYVWIVIMIYRTMKTVDSISRRLEHLQETLKAMHG